MALAVPQSGWGHIPQAILSTASSNVSSELTALKIALGPLCFGELELWRGGKAKWVTLLFHEFSFQHALEYSICLRHFDFQYF